MERDPLLFSAPLEVEPPSKEKKKHKKRGPEAEPVVHDHDKPAATESDSRLTSLQETLATAKAGFLERAFQQLMPDSKDKEAPTESEAEPAEAEDDEADEAELSELSHEEESEVLAQIVDAQAESVQQEHEAAEYAEPADSIETQVVAADAAFLEAVREELAEEKRQSAPVEQALSAGGGASVEQTIPLRQESRTMAEVVDAAFAKVTGEAPDDLQDQDAAVETREEPHEVMDYEPMAAEEADKLADVPAGPAGSGFGAARTGVGGAGQFGHVPPISPAWRSGGVAAFGAETAGTSVAAETANTGGALLVGGVVGYLVGRRHGRIKSEKRLKPIQEKLEQQVKAIQTVVVEKEQRIRELTRQKLEQASVAPAPKLEAVAHDVAQKSEERAQEATAASRPYQEMSSTVPVDHHREQPGLSQETARDRPSETIKTPLKSIATMNRQELIHAAEEIVIGATTVDRILETNLITEAGARRVVEAFQRGNEADVRRILSEELLAKELSYERDPLFKGRQMSQTASSGSTAAQSSMSDPAVTREAPESRVNPKTVPSQLAQLLPPGLRESAQRAVPPVLIVANIGALIVLVVLLLVLFVVNR